MISSGKIHRLDGQVAAEISSIFSAPWSHRCRHLVILQNRLCQIALFIKELSKHRVINHMIETKDCRERWSGPPLQYSLNKSPLRLLVEAEIKKSILILKLSHWGSSCKGQPHLKSPVSPAVFSNHIQIRGDHLSHDQLNFWIDLEDVWKGHQ